MQPTDKTASVSHRDVLVNNRSLSSPLTGVQRYSAELAKRLGSERIKSVAPSKPLHGAGGHLWEQTVLAYQCRNCLLWSPANTGPLLVSRQVVTIHDVATLDHPEWFSPRFAAWYRWLTPRLAKRAGRIITVSEFTKQRILAHAEIDSERIARIYIGVADHFHPLQGTELKANLTTLQLPSCNYVLTVGSIEPRKNLGHLIKAWDMASRHIPDDVWLVIAGARGSAQVFNSNSMAKMPARVHFTGHIPDEQLPALYAGAIAFAYPSLYEGFGLPPLEAMACGTPVLTSSVSSLPEVVGDAAILVDPRDVEDIADGLLRLVENSTLRDTLRWRGLERVKAFSWDECARQTWAVLQAAAEAD